MRTLRSACAVLATVFACAIGAAPAIADTVVIDSVDSPSSVFQPANVTIETGDTVRWEFDAAATTHNVVSQSSNWSINESRGPNGAPIERTFNTAGTYTFLCNLHTGMTGSITVEAPTLDRVLVFSKTGGFRHDSIPQGIAAIQALGTANDFDVVATEDAAAVHGREPRHLRRRRLHVDDRRDPQRRPAGARSSASSRPAAASPASTPPPTPSTPGRGSASWSAATSATIRPERPARRSTSRTATSPPRPAFRRAGRARTSGTTSSTRRPRSSTATRRSPTTAPRARHVKVLATVDESTYDEQDGNTIDDDHPVAWCSDFDGGRSWYTAMGHTQASFADAQFRAAPARRPAHRGRRRR